MHVADRTRSSFANAPDANERKRLAAIALIRFCYEAARTRYAELAAWRHR